MTNLFQLKFLHKRGVHIALEHKVQKGLPLNILYDSGASTCFARTDLPMLANAESAQRQGNLHGSHKHATHFRG